MKQTINHITAWLLLLASLPGLLGVGLVSHYCNTCNSAQKEATLLIWPHNHEDSPCACETANHQGQCKIDSKKTHHHEHHCQIAVKKLDIPINSLKSDQLLPELFNFKIRFDKYLYTTSFFQNNTTFRGIKESPPPRFMYYQGPQRLSVFGVFRL